MDYSLFRDINGLSGAPLPDHVFRFVAERFEIALIALVALIFLIPWRAHRQELRIGAVFATAAAAIGLLVNQPISHAVDRLRPYVAHPATAHLLIARSHDPSFPSDHATGGFALACGMFLYDRLVGTILFVLAALLAFSRVYVGTHYPADVLGGALIGVLAALLLRIPIIRHPLERFATQVSRIWDALIQRVRGEPTLTTPPRS